MNKSILVCVDEIVGGEYVATTRFTDAFKKSYADFNVLHLKFVKPKKYKIFNFILSQIQSFLILRKQIIGINKKHKLRYVFSANYASTLAACSLIGRNFPVVHMFHGTKAGLIKSIPDLNYRKFILRLAESLSYALADKISAPSLAAKKYLNRNTLYFANKKIFLLNNIVPNIFFEKKDKKISNEKIILYSGRMAENKGIEELTKSFVKIKKLYPETKIFYMYPSANVNKKVFSNTKNIIRKNKFNKSCFFIKDPTNKEMVKVYKKASVLVLASLIEFAPLSILEAFASGLPVAATNVGNAAELIVKVDPNMIIASSSEQDIYKTLKYFFSLERKTIFGISKKQKAIAENYRSKNVIEYIRKEIVI